MHARLVKIGNSHGVRLPKAVIEEAHLGPALELVVSDGAVVIRSATGRRKGWAEDARDCHSGQDDRLAEWDSAVADGDWK